MGDGRPVYELAAHISCPFASRTSLIHEKALGDILTGRDVFPAAASWNAIIHQYTRSPVEVVVLDMKPPQDLIACTLTFQSPGETAIRLGLEVFGDIVVVVVLILVVNVKDEDEDEDEFQMPSEEMVLKVFSQASRTARDYPLLSNVKRLYIGQEIDISELVQLRNIANEVGRLFESVGPLDRLILYGYVLEDEYSIPFLDFLVFEDNMITFPPIKELTILYPPGPMTDGEGPIDTYTLDPTESGCPPGEPFERVTMMCDVRMAEIFGPWSV